MFKLHGEASGSRCVICKSLTGQSLRSSVSGKHTARELRGLLLKGICRSAALQPERLEKSLSLESEKA